MNNIQISQANDSHASAIKDMIFDIWINEYGFDVRDEDYPDLKHIQSYYHDRGGQFWVAELDGRVFGTIACDKLEGTQFVLKRMFVHNEARGQGIGQKLLDTIFRHLPSDSTVFLSTKEDEALAAKALYLKNGFAIIEKSELPTGFPFFYEDDLFMKKNL